MNNIEEKAKVSIVLVNYNSTHHTINCINSIRNRERERERVKLVYTIIVVDNNSKEEEKQKLKDWLKLPEQSDIISIFSEKNTGFTGGNMLGVKQAESKYIYLLNNDCILQNNALSILFDFMENNPNVAAVSPKMLNNDKKPTPAFSYMPSAFNKWFGNRLTNLLNPSKYPDRKRVYDKPIKVEVITGASMFLRESAFEAVGYMDPAYFLYLEEEDLCMKLAKAGFEIYHVPKAVIQHLGGESTKRNFDIAKEYYISLCYFLRKHYSSTERFLIKLRYLIRELFSGFRDPTRFRLFTFLLKDAPEKYSLRYKQ